MNYNKYCIFTRNFQSVNALDIHVNLKPHFWIFLVQDLLFYTIHVTAGFRRNKKKQSGNRRKDLVKTNTCKPGVPDARFRGLRSPRVFNGAIHYSPLFPLIPSAKAPSSLGHVQGEPICVLWIHPQFTSRS